MPLFLSEEEFQLLSHDPAQLAERADFVIIDLRLQLDTARAEADAACIASEQTYNILEQRYSSLSAELARVQSESASVSASAEQRLAEAAEAQAAKHELYLKSVAKDGDIERLKVELSELHKSRRQLLDVVAQKDAEIAEKNATIQSYLDRIVSLTENAAAKESKLHETEAELARCRAACSRLSQEKDLIEKHNKWLNDELTEKVNSLVELRKAHIDFEADMSTKLADAERRFSETSKSLKQSEERVKEYKIRIASLEEELRSCHSAAATNEQNMAAELTSATKLTELYKESSEEWSKKAGELEGVIKALEMHLTQVQNDHKERVERELSVREDLEKEAKELKEKLEKHENELEKARKSNEHKLMELPYPYDRSMDESFTRWTDDMGVDAEKESNQLIVLKKPDSISGTALAVSLLRDGWSLAKMYEKYQEATDALRHERWARRHSEALLERVLHEIEQKAEIIMEERVEHEKLVEAYTSIEQKLQQALAEYDVCESQIRNLKAECKRKERDYGIAQKEILDLEKEVSVLLKECKDIQIRCGVADQSFSDEALSLSIQPSLANDISGLKQFTFKNIAELVRQNTELRGRMQSLSFSEETHIAELKENFQFEIKKLTEEAAAKVEAVLKRSEEQGRMLESLQSAVAMYKKLYEEEHRLRSSGSTSTQISPEDENKEHKLLYKGSQEAAKMAYEKVIERVRLLEEDLAKSRSEIMSLQVERDKTILEAKFMREKLDSSMKEFDRQREETTGVAARNIELTTILVDYQRRLREATDSLNAVEGHSRKLSVEVSVLKTEKEVLSNSEKRALDEIQCLTERFYRLQASLDTIQSVEEVREESRSLERRKLEEHIGRIEKELAETKKELQDERDRVRKLTAERETAIEDSMEQINQMRKELSDAWRAVSSAESRAAVAEDRNSNLEAMMKKRVDKLGDVECGSLTFNAEEAVGDVWKLKEELEKVKDEAQANKNYMMQYKEIAYTNEAALKQIELTHEEFKIEAEKLKKSLESEIILLRENVTALEKECILKSNEAFSATAVKEDAVSSFVTEIGCLKEENSKNMAHITTLESQVSFLKENLEREHVRWRMAQTNYERQVVLQSETIQEMEKISHTLASLQDEASELRKLSDNLNAENEALKSSWKLEKSLLLESKEEAEKKYFEVDEQNTILHKRLEALHDKFAKEHRVGAASDEHKEGDLQSVISHLRRAKEIAQTEVTLLKQEKLRLQSQLEISLKASERAEAVLRKERESSREILFSDEEFKSLKLQVKEINLLRESNAQLREENKHNFEECQRYREMAQSAQVECEHLVKERDSIVEGLQNEIELLRSENKQLEEKVAELIKKTESINVIELEKVKDELLETKVKLKETVAECEMVKKLLAEKQERMSLLEQELENAQKKSDEAQKMQILQTSDAEKHKKIAANWKKKIEVLNREKEEIIKEKQSLQKQIADAVDDKKLDTEGKNKEAIREKEKDTRIQILEKTLEREREYLRKEKEENKKEKARRAKLEKTLVDRNDMIREEKQKLEEEIKAHKSNVRFVLEGIGITASLLPPESGLDERSAAYFFAIERYEEEVNNVTGEAISSEDAAADSLHVESITASGQQFVRQSTGQPTHPQGHSIEQGEKGGSQRSTDARKTVRKIVRPRLEHSEEPTIDPEVEADEPTSIGAKVGDSNEEEPPACVGALAVSRKRIAGSSASNFNEDTILQHELESDAVPSSKRPKASDSFHGEAEGEPIPPVDGSLSVTPSEDAHANEDIFNIRKDENADNADLELQEKPNELTDEINQEVEVKDDTECAIDTGKAMDISELDEEMQRSDESQQLHQSIMVADDDMEEGEMPPDDQDVQLEEVEPGLQESLSGDAPGIGDLEGDGVDINLSEVSEGKTDGSDVVDQIVEDVDKSSGEFIENEESLTTSSVTPVEIQDAPSVSSLPDQAGSGITTETGDVQEAPRSRKIVISERARQNALLRQAGLSQAQARGRGRAIGGFRRDAGSGGRGGRLRGGRGPSSSDRD